MKVTLVISGGLASFPVFESPSFIDTSQVDSLSAARIESWVRDAHFFELPALQTAAVRGAADYRSYTMTVNDGTRAHTVQFTDPISDTNLVGLVSSLRSIAGPPAS